MHSARSLRGAWLALMAVSLIAAGCGGGKKQDDQGIGGGASMAVTTEDKFKVPPGADPSVPADQGGNGFDDIAAAQGWKTGTLTEEQFKLIADENAKKGGMLKFAVSEFPATFRQYGKDENSSTTRLINNMVYESLIGINPMTYDFLPSLASHWKVDADGQTYWYRINPNARFSDGHPVTTDDVLATYKLAMDSTILSPYTNSFYQEFDAPVAVSKYIFKVRSKEKMWRNMLGFGGTTILPAHVIGNLSGTQYLEKYQYEMVPGTGPYIVLPKDVEKQKSVTMTRRTNWWAKDERANRGQMNFDKIRMEVVREERLMLEKFKKGELDLYIVSRAQWWREEFDYDEIKRGIVRKRRVFNDNPVGVSGFVFNMREEPFNDPRVREAFILLFNREKLVEKLMFNQYILTDSYYPNSVYENPNNPRFRYNPQRASQLLAEAGYNQRNSEGILVKNGKPFVIELAITEGMERIVTPVQQDLKDAGIMMKLRNIDGPSNFKLMNERKFKIAWINWGATLFPNPKSSYRSDFADVPNTNNLAGFKNARADELIEAEQVDFDVNRRIAMLRELDSILMESRQYALAWYGPYTRMVYWNKFGQPEFYLGRVSDWYEYILPGWWYDPEKAETMNKGRKDKSVTMPVGETDVMFWPNYNKTHPPVLSISATQAVQSGGDSTAKPDIK